jgi:hypothetical protein
LDGTTNSVFLPALYFIQFNSITAGLGSFNVGDVILAHIYTTEGYEYTAEIIAT